MKTESVELLAFFQASCKRLSEKDSAYYGTQIDYASGPIIAAAQKIIEADLLSHKLSGKFANLTTIKVALAQAEREAHASHANGQEGCVRCDYRGLLPFLCTYDTHRTRYDWQVVRNLQNGPAHIYEIVGRCRCKCSPNVQIPVVSNEQLDGYERYYEPYLKVEGGGSHSRAWNCAARHLLLNAGFKDTPEFRRLNRIAKAAGWKLIEKGAET